MKKSKILTLTLVAVIAVGMLLSAGYAVDCAHENTITYKGVAATCETAGWTPALYCNDCGTTMVAREAIPALGHDEVTVAAQAPTCTETGLTEGAVCGRCGVVIVSQQIVAATGEHSYDCVVTTEPSVGVEGVKTYTCAVCGDSYTESIPALEEEETQPTTPPAEEEETQPTTPPVEEEEDPVVTPDGGNSGSSVQGGTVSPKTGDSSVMFLLMGVAVVAVSTGVMLRTIKKVKA